MPRITFNIELSNKPDRTGRSSVMVRLHMKGQKPARVVTGVKIIDAEKNWSLKRGWGKWVIRLVDKDSLNDKIKKEHDRIRDQVEKWQADEPGAILPPALLAERFRAGVFDLYFVWVDKVLEDTKEQAYATYLAKRTAVNSFRAWAGEDFPLQSVTPVVARQYQAFLRKPTEGGLRRKGSTINKMLNRLHVIHQSVLVKTGISPKQAVLLSPWTDIEPEREVKPRKSKLSESAVQELARVEVASTRRRITPETAFHFWMLARLLAGMRFSDLMHLRYRNFQVDETGQPVQLQYEMLKTGNRVNIPVFAEAQMLLKTYWKEGAKPTDYILPYLHNDRPYNKLLTHEQYKSAPFAVRRRLYNDLAHWNRQLNLCLKEVEQAAGLTDKLRSHNARHSFADLARRIMESDKSLTLYDIQMMLGHSSIKTTEMYTEDLTERDLTQPMRAIFDRKETK